MDLYQLIVFVHVAAAVALLSGSVIASPGVRAAVRRAQITQDIRAYLAIGRPLLVLEPASAVVLASGLYLMNVANFWTQGRVQVSIAFWIANAVVAGAMVKPAIGRVAAEAARAPDGPVGHDLDVLRRSLCWSLGGDRRRVGHPDAEQRGRTCSRSVTLAGLGRSTRTQYSDAEEERAAMQSHD